MKRLYAIDFTRGLVMIIMALDHTRDFMHVSSLTQNPTDLATTTPSLFLTRWITHLCAPVFVFLSGTSAFLSFKKEGDHSKSKTFLLSRGLWLLILEFTLVNFALWFDLQFRILIFEVIGAIGFGFIVLALILKFPPGKIGITGLIIIFGHNLLQYISFSDTSSPLGKVASSFFSLSVFQANPQFTFVVGYPPLPWLGIMLTGFAAGQLFTWDERKRKMAFLKIGLTVLGLFIIIRLLNFYGDTSAWSIQKTNLNTFLSFINVSKYPPSLLFSLVTLGIMFLILSAVEGVNNIFTKNIVIYGQVPLFYFLIHLYMLHFLMLVMVYVQGFSWSALIFGPFNIGRPKNGSGLELWLIYLIWLLIVVALYPLCKWYGSYKANHRENKWLRYV
ncbi:MAG: heparan-alpha-glucosaminide N-acetyltransferase domain-containing protein [Chitinophagaceae bacterium]